MDLVSMGKKRRKRIIILPLLAGVIGYYPLETSATLYNYPVSEVAQSKSLTKRTVQGVVYDAVTNETLIGVNVRIKGTSQGTVTDMDGKFYIDVTGKDELIFS